MSYEIGERVVYRSLQWEVVNHSSENVIELYGRSRANQGRTIRAVLGLETIERAEPPPLTWTIGETGWDPNAWKAMHDAYRLTLSQGRGFLGSADWGRLILEPYQLTPLRRIENLPFPRLMIADDTGLGKTAEAGLIVFRLMQRRRAERILVLTRAKPEPERWQAEMREKFGIDFVTINNANDYARIRRDVPSHLNVFGHVPRLVMSMHFAAQPHVVDDLRRDVRWDIVIVDEAHHLAVRGAESKRLAELGRVVAERSDALLLLTATPHDGKGESFASLIRLLDPYAIVDPDHLDPNIVRPLLVRRLKPQVVRADGTRFIRRQIDMLDVEPYRTPAERKLDKGLRKYAELLRKRAAQLEAEGERGLAMGASFLETFLRKRLASSAYACGISLNNRLKKIQGKDLPTENEETLEDASQTALQPDPFTFADGRTEQQVVSELIGLASAVPFGEEAKVHALLDLLRKKLAGQKVIVFTEFVDTLTMLTGVLEQNGFKGQYVTYTGGESRVPDKQGNLHTATRDEVRQTFLNEPDIRLFIGTDAASEGINLQKSCSALVHIEIPWNPNRYEQRNGRIDRYGQHERPRIFLLVATKSLEDRVAKVVLEKMETIAEQVGSVSNVFPIANRISIDDYLESVDEDAAAAQASAAFDQAAADTTAQLSKEVPDELIRGTAFDAAEMEQISRELEQARTFAPAFDDVQRFIEFYFRTEGGQIKPTKENHVFEVSVPASLRKDVNVDRYARATFNREIAVSEEDRADGKRVEFLSPGHPLVRAALRRMRGRLFHTDFKSRVSYRKFPSTPLLRSSLLGEEVGSRGGFIFTYAMRFVDERGETLDERFEPVFVSVSGVASASTEDDLRRFATVEPVKNANLNEREREQELPRYKAAFATAQQAANAEIKRRQAIFANVIEAQQERIAEDALVRLGSWKRASEERVNRRFEDLHGVTQLDLMGAVSRRLQQFQKEQMQLLKQEESRREEIRRMKHVRGDAIDPIGALVLIEEVLA